jgi:hypothetical protein
VTDRDVILAVMAAKTMAVAARTSGSRFARAAVAAAAASNGTVTGLPLAIVASGTPLEYAGKSLAVADFDVDGTADLVITAYGHTANPLPTSRGGAAAAVAEDGGLGVAPLLPQSGAFYVRYGNATGAQQPEGAAAAGAAPAPAIPQPLPDYPTYGAAEYMRLGWASCVLDFNAGGWPLRSW